MLPPRLVLASTSRYRQALLARLGVAFDVEAPACDETQYQTRIPDPFDLALALAAAKAEAVAHRHPDAIVIGSDQVCAIDGTVLGKPGDRPHALAQLQSLQGRTHDLITAVCVHTPTGRQAFHDVSRLRMRALDDKALLRYLDRDEPYDCAGAYKLEAAGITLFATIQSADHTAITGLPLLQLTGVLRTLGFAIP